MSRGIEVSVSRDRDGAQVVRIITDGVAGRVRVNLNNNPPLYDGRPENDGPDTGDYRERRLSEGIAPGRIAS